MKKSKLFSVILVAILLISACIYYIYSKKIEFTGIIESTKAEINSEVSGKIIEAKKNEGDRLSKDEIIAVIDSTGQKKIIRDLERIIVLKKTKLSQAKTISYTEELELAKANIENIRKNLEYWTDKYNRINKKYLSGNISESEYLDAKVKLNTVQEQLAIAEVQYEQLKKKPRKNASNNTAKSDLEKASADLELQKLNLSKYEIRSPIEGICTSKRIKSGDMISAGSNIATVTNPEDLWVKFDIPQKYESLIINGGKINLILGSDKSMKISGEISDISGSQNKNSLLGVKVKILDNRDKLKPGMTVSMKIKRNSLTVFSMLKTLFSFA